MMPIVLTILVCVISALASLCMLVLMVASAPNSSPTQYAVIKGIMWFVFISSLSVIGAIVALFLGKHPTALLLSVWPMIAVLIAFTFAWDASKYLADPTVMPSIGRLIARGLVVLIFGGGGVVMFYVGAREWIVQRAALTESISVPAQIIESVVRTSTSEPAGSGDLLKNDSTTTHTADVRFRYTINSQTYESDRLRPSAIVQSHGSKQSAADELKPFPVGATVSAFVIPSMPDKAFLIRETSAGPFVFMILGFLLTPIALLATRLV